MAKGFALGQPYSDGESFQQVIDLANPGANTNGQFKPDARWTYRLISCVFTLTTDANAGNRYVTLEHWDGRGLAYAVDASAITFPANTTGQRFCGSVGRGFGANVAAGDVLFSVTPAFLIPGYTLNIIVGGKQAGDALTAIRFLFDTFPTGDADYPGDSD